MFTDKFRLVKIFAPLFIIFLIIIYGEIKGPLLYPGFLEASKNPRQFINKEISFGGKIIKINKNYFLIEVEKKPVKVLGSLEKDKLNYSINGKAIYLSDGSLKLLKFHLSNIRIYKIILSIIPIILIGYLFFKEYKFDKKTYLFVKIKK